jgi:hypothetical protein
MFFSPDGSGNPFCFFFKNKKIATNSWISSKKKRLKKKRLKVNDFCEFF